MFPESTYKRQQREVPAGRRRVLFVLRMHGELTGGRRELVEYYAEKLHGVAEFWVHYDATCRAKGGIRGGALVCPDMATIQGYMDALKARSPNFGFWHFTDEDVAKDLPDVTWPKGITAVPYNFHTVTLNMWLMKQKPLEEITHVWKVEDDTLFAGDVADFVRHYQGEDYAEKDYLGWRMGASNGDIWPHRHKNTFQVPSRFHLRKSQHIERYSTALLMTLWSLTKLNIVMYGEAFATTVCNAFESCTMHDMSEGSFFHRDQKKYHCWDCRVTHDEWRSYLIDPPMRDKWYHACKFVAQDTNIYKAAAAGG